MPRSRRPALLLVVAALTSACAASAPTASPTAPAPSVAATSIAALPSIGPSGAPGGPSGVPGQPPGGGDPGGPGGPGGPTEPPASPGAGQGIVEGSVLDAAGQPVPNVQVSVASGGTASCCADIPAPGRFHLALPAGIHELLFSAPGFLPVTKPVTLEAGQRLVVDVVLVAGEPSPEPRVTLRIVPGAAAANPTPVGQVVDGKLSGRLTVTGMLIGQLGGEMQLCAAVLESYPPQCGGPSLVIQGLQVGLLKGLQQANGVVWLNEALTLTGDVGGGAAEGISISGTVFTVFRDGRRCADQDATVASSLSGVILTFSDEAGGIHGSAVTGDLTGADGQLGCRFSAAYSATLPSQPTYRVAFVAPDPKTQPGGGYFDGANQLSPATITLAELQAGGFVWDFEAPPAFVVP